jgi:outer membrane protein TolC
VRLRLITTFCLLTYEGLTLAQEPGTRINVREPPPILESVPAGKVTPELLPLTLSDAIDRGLRNNLGVVLGDLGTRRATATRLAELASLLPSLTASVSEASQQINLQSLGFRGFAGVPPIIGPFQVFDARAFLSQAVLDWSALSSWRGSKESVNAATLAARNVRDAVVLAVVNLYLQAVAGGARVDAAAARVATAEAEYKQAANMKSAGVVAGIDVLRAQVQMQSEQQNLIALRNDVERYKLDLSRAIGLPPGQQFSLATQVPFTPAPALELQDALRSAYENRSDYLASEALARAAEWRKRAAESKRLPALYFNGNYGTIGPSMIQNHGTYTAALALQFPIFDSGRIRARIEEADAALEEQRADEASLRGRIDYEVRTALLDLNAAREQVTVAESAQKLAGEQLVQARDRFAAGVANNLEVVQAQQAVATAQENLIRSLYAWNLARAALLRASGMTSRIASDLAGGGKP